MLKSRQKTRSLFLRKINLFIRQINVLCKVVTKKRVDFTEILLHTAVWRLRKHSVIVSQFLLRDFFCRFLLKFSVKSAL